MMILAPMAELSHRALRHLIEDFNIDGAGRPDEYYTEMISAPALRAGGPFEKWYIDNGPCPERLVFQLVGGEAEDLAAAAAILDKIECKGIDINMGCAAPAILRTGGGARWLEDADRAASMVAQVRRATGKQRLSVKMRLTANHANHANWGNNSQIVKDDYLEGTLGFCRKLIDAGVERIALHPRALKQKFKGKADWSFVEALARELPVPVIGNGDVDSGEALAARLEGQTKGLWAGVMVGRAAIKEPWIFSLRASAPPRENIGLKFLDYLSQYQPPEFHLSRAQRFFFYFCDNLKWGNYLKTVINRETSLTGIEKVWKKHFAENEEP